MTIENDVLSSVTPQGDPLAELVGEGKKYKDAAALAASRLEADRFIEQLRSENAGLRRDLEAASKTGDQKAAIDALMKRIEEATKGQNGNPPSTLTREEVDKLVKEGITTAQSQAAQRANYVKSNAELLNHFKGDEATARTYLTTRASELGLDKDGVTKLASENPNMFRELFIPKPKTQSNPQTLPPGRSVPNTDSTVRGKSYYTNLRKELGNKYWDPAIQQQLFADRKRLGEQFNET